MRLYWSNSLLDKIKELEDYVSAKASKSTLKVEIFLKDLRSIEPNLSILSLVNYLVDMHRDGLSLQEIIDDVDKTKRIFKLVDEYIKYVEEDSCILDLFKEIHDVIILRLNKALHIYKQEFDLS